jgi:hypothetical protein
VRPWDSPGLGSWLLTGRKLALIGSICPGNSRRGDSYSIVVLMLMLSFQGWQGCIGSLDRGQDCPRYGRKNENAREKAALLSGFQKRIRAFWKYQIAIVRGQLIKVERREMNGKFIIGCLK